MTTWRSWICAAVVLFALVSLGGVLDAGPPEQRSPGTERRLVLPDGRLSGLSGAYWATALANGGPAPRHERLLVVMPDGRLLDVIDGERDHVLLPVELSRELSQRKLDVALVHNHPAGVSLSGTDLMHLAKIGVAAVIAIGSEGSVYEASAGARFDVFDDGLYLGLIRRLQDRLAREAWRSNEDPGALYQHVPHLAAVVLHRARVIDYRVVPSLTAHLAFVRYREVLERVATAEVRRLEQDLTPHGRPPDLK
ncbi:MAG TPA: hypothetical protein VH679_00140 [Vicinamibacterales bacterium]|jgi:hypothetical protein